MLWCGDVGVMMLCFLVGNDVMMTTMMMAVRCSVFAIIIFSFRFPLSFSSWISAYKLLKALLVPLLDNGIVTVCSIVDVLLSASYFLHTYISVGMAEFPLLFVLFAAPDFLNGNSNCRYKEGLFLLLRVVDF